MSALSIIKALRPVTGEAQQLFIAFVDNRQNTEGIEYFINTISQHFPQAVMMVVMPDDEYGLMAETGKILQNERLSDEQLASFVFHVVPQYITFIQHVQEPLNVSPAATALIGVGQVGSAILELTKLAEPLAGRLFAFGARYVSLPTEAVSLKQTIHLLHAGKDGMTPVLHAAQAHETLTAFEGDASIDVGHLMEQSFTPELINKMVERLQTCVPLRYWKEAQSMRDAQDDHDEGAESGASGHSIH